ncbi:MAG: DUF5685 family protein [Oscillospiraceae bacterium]|nr:DUF5685 family protein [Oscillospiraceae bacterium]
MFGYIRPLQGELKVNEYERFKACYCGLCHALGRKYGFASRLILNYELVFLSMLLWGEDEPVEIKRRRCIASPFCKKRYCVGSRALDACAGYSVILTWWKLRDTVADEPFVKSLPHRFFSLLLLHAYKKAAREHPEFDCRTREGVVSLEAHESRQAASIDAAADKFANILRAAAPESAVESLHRPMSELLYHLGRWIYIMDACDDYTSDAQAGRYNPVLALYLPEEGKLPEGGAARMKTTLDHSNNLVSSAFELMPENPWSQTVRNVIYLGMPDARARVFSGRWPPHRRKITKNGHD